VTTSSRLLALLLLAGCQSSPSERPIPATRIRLTVDDLGTYSLRGLPLQFDSLHSLVKPPTAVPEFELNLTPIVLEMSLGLEMGGLRKVLDDLMRCHCVNIALDVRHLSSATEVQLPIVTRTYPRLLVFDGEQEVSLVDKQDTLEVVARVGAGGTILVSGVSYTREYVFFPEKPGDPVPDYSWKGLQPRSGAWTVDELRDFLERPDLAALSPYVGLDISSKDRAGDVVRCLANMRRAAGSRVDPNFILR
jgi:hypothetical protein